MSRYVQISLGLHVAAFLWLWLGDVFEADPPEMTVADVTVISVEDFAALSAPAQAAWVVAPTISTRAEISDNVRLRTDGNEESGTITRTTAQAEVRNVTDTWEVAGVGEDTHIAIAGFHGVLLCQFHPVVALGRR